MIDYRNDPKASTGSFEMIYRQVIPPAPAYLGLNLFLKGTPVMSKNGGGKKEKPKLDTKPKTERKMSHLTVKNGQNNETDKTPILSPRSLLIDFTDCNDNSTSTNLTSARKRICTLTRSNKENVFKNDKVMTGRLHSYLALTRYPPKHSDLRDPMSSRKSGIRVPDSSRRHASCGPKLMTVAQPDENKVEVKEFIENDRNYIKCVGNKCGPEVEITDTSIETNKSSPSKPSQDSSRAANMKTKLKPINTLSKSARTLSSNSKDKSATNPNEYRKYLAQSSLQLNKMPANGNSYSNSHFSAVGMSLRAWRSKHNKTKGSATVTNNSSLKRKNG